MTAKEQDALKKAIDGCVRVLDRVLNIGIVVLGMLILFISAYSLLDHMWLYQNASDSSLLTYKPSPDAPEQSGNKNQFLDGQVAWLCIEDTYIDFPVMQGETNFDYLNKDPYGEYRISGSIFLDYRNHGDFSDDFSMIYGHHMDHYNMFGSLDLFTSEAYFHAHEDGWLAVKDRILGLKLFAVVWGDSKDKVMFSPQGRTTDEVLTYIKEKALIYTAHQPGRRIVALSTCAGETSTSRLIVLGMIDER